MSNEAFEDFEKALKDRDEAIKTKLTDLEKSSQTLVEKSAGIADRLFHLEQSRGEHFDDGGNYGTFLKGGHKYDLMKSLRHAIDPSKFRLDGLEAEQHQEWQQKMEAPMPNTVWVPLNAKAVDYSTVNFNSPLQSAGGSNVVPQQLGSLVDTLYQSSTVMRLNPTVISASGDYDLPTKSGNTTASWVSGEGQDISESTPTFGKISLRPKYLSGLTTIYARMLTQTGGGIEQIVAQDLMDVLAVELDRAAIQGSGSGSEPQGIIGTTNVLTDTWDTTSPKSLTWADILEMERLLQANNSSVGNVASVMDPATFKTAKSTTKVSGDAGAGFLLDGGMLNGYQAYATNNAPANTIVHGNWRDLIFSHWGALGIAVDPYGTSFASGSHRVRAMLACDINVRHPASFVVSTLA